MSTVATDSVLPAAISDLTIKDADPTIPQCAKARSTGSRTKARDITGIFARAATALATGELMKDKAFTLYEAVGALEVIMDPRMDSGFLAPRETLEDDYDILRPISPEEAIGIMDSMICSEVAWHMGHPLSQTLFTSLYLDRMLWPEPKTLGQANFHRGSHCTDEIGMLHLVLRAYCLLVVKTCDYVHRRIVMESYYEEEDFVTNLYHRSLLTKFTKDDILLISQQAIEYVETYEASQTSIPDALLCRLRFRQALLEATAVEPDDFKACGPEAWGHCLPYITPISTSSHLGSAVPSSFSVKVQRRLTSSVPPRPIVNVSFDTSCAFFKKLCEDGRNAAMILQCPRTSNIFTFLRVFLSGKPQSSLYIRCLLQSLVFTRTRHGGKDTEREMIFRELEELVLPCHSLSERSNAEIELPRDRRFQIWMKMSQCASQLFDAYHDLLRALCMNRPRSRRMLCHLIFDWDNLQLDLEDIDTELRQYTHEKPIFGDVEAWELPLSSFAYLHKLRQMEWVVQLGFELNIYHVDERAGMYQYLHVLADTRQKHVDRIYGFVHHHYCESASSRPAEATTTFEHSLSVLEFLSEEAAAIAQLAQAFASLYQALDLLQLIPIWPLRPYSNKKFRRAIRLRPFLQICPPQLKDASEPFDQIGSLVDSLQYSGMMRPSTKNLRNENIAGAIALLDHADTLGRAARKGLELLSKATPEAAMCVGCEPGWRNGIKEIMRVAIVAGIFGAQVKKWVTNGARQTALDLKFIDNEEDEAPGNMGACWIVPSIVSLG